MADLNPVEPVGQEVPAQTIKRPLAVWVFGIFNILFGVWGIIRLSLKFIRVVKYNASVGIVPKVLAYGVDVGMAVWLLILGIGLLTMKKWARRGSMMYARIEILLVFISVGFKFYLLFSGPAALPSDKLVIAIPATIIILIGGLVYPILLLIFMQTVKVKRAFEAVGG